MSRVVRKLFNIYPGEERNALFFVLLAYIWAIGISCGNKFSDALFLVNIGSESLPQAYFITSCGLLTAAAFLLAALNRLSPTHIFLGILAFDLLFYASVSFSVWTGFGFDTVFFWFVFKIVTYILFAITLTCFWVFVDHYYHIQDAKRLFTFFNAAVFMGDATTGILMRLNIFVLDTLMIYILTALCGGFFLALYLSKTTKQIYDDILLEEGGAIGEHRSLMFLVRSVLNSRFTILLMSFNLLMQLMLVVTEFNYFSTFTERFGEPENDQLEEGMGSPLTLFLGQWVAAVGFFNLMMGIFIYSRLIRKFGISNLVMLTPMILVVAFSGWLTSNSLLFPIMGLFVVEGTLYTVDDSNFTLLLNAVPTKVKYKIRVMIESFFEPAGMLLSSILLSISTTYSKILGLILSSIWLAVALGLRSQYLNALFSNLWENAIHLGRSAKRWFHLLRSKDRKSAEHRLLAILRQGDAEAQIFACECLIAFDDHGMIEKMLGYIDKMSSEAKIKFLKFIETTSYAIDGTVLDKIQNWLYEDHHPKLKSTVNFYLAKHGLFHPEKAIHDLDSNDPELVGAAIVALKSSWAHLSPTTAALNRTLAVQRLEDLLESENIEKKCIGIHVLGCEATSTNVDMLFRYLKDPSIQIAKAAAYSMALIIDRQSARYATQIISLLTFVSDSEFRLACLQALGKIIDSSLIRPLISAVVHFRANEKRKVEEVIYKMGLRTVPALLSITKDKTMHDRSRIVASRILGRLALPQLHANLYDIIREEIKRAQFYFLHYQTIKKEHPDIEVSLLKKTLKAGYDSVLEFIIQLLGTAGSIEDSEMLYHALRSPNIKVRGDAVEALEKTCDPQIFHLLYPLVGDIPMEEKMRSLHEKPLSLTTLLDTLDQSPSQADRIMAATMKYRLKIPNWRETLRRQMSTNEELFHHFAYELLEL